ncbi:hypothetical protein [Alicyclobacillus acidocaldarius]|uniref:hypothetical protein n=1 Tax=Alicyclobacillus acidocaldarius TaxID=405212 RepID=UPI001ED97457|nr:hypothetical protein [Alicyclobacillus acidocaldarius]
MPRCRLIAARGRVAGKGPFASFETNHLCKADRTQAIAMATPRLAQAGPGSWATCTGEHVTK